MTIEAPKPREWWIAKHECGSNHIIAGELPDKYLPPGRYDLHQHVIEHSAYLAEKSRADRLQELHDLDGVLVDRRDVNKLRADLAVEKEAKESLETDVIKYSQKILNLSAIIQPEIDKLKTERQVMVDALNGLVKFTSELCDEIKVSRHYPSLEKAREALKKVGEE